MAKVKVWNDNKYPHTEKFKGELVTIAPQEFIEMEYEEAVEFKGNFTEPKRLGDGTHDPRFFKMIRVERPAVLPFRDENILHATGTRVASPQELAALSAQFAHMQAPRDADAETQSFADIAELKAQVAALKEKLETRGPGRPRKEA